MPKENLLYYVSEFNALTDRIFKVILEPSHTPINYQSGQYVHMVTQTNKTLAFSIANAPEATSLKCNQLEFHIQINNDNLNLRQLFFELTNLKCIKVCGPYGNLVYRNKQIEKLIFLAGGTGFAPIKALIEQSIVNREYPKPHLFWYAKNPTDFYLLNLATHWVTIGEIDFTPVLLSPSENKLVKCHIGNIHEAILATYPDLSNSIVYAAGSYKMILNAYTELTRQGLNKHSFISDMLEIYNPRFQLSLDQQTKDLYQDKISV